MQFSGIEAQIFIGVAVILGCAFVALLCDYLKGVNERLREHALELTVRLEETERWGQKVAALQQQIHPEAGASADAGIVSAQAAAQVAAQNEVQNAVKDELARLHREVEQMSRSVASLAELRVAMGDAVKAEPVEQERELVAAGSHEPMAIHEVVPPIQPAAILKQDAPAAMDLPFVARGPEPAPVARSEQHAPQAMPVHTPAMDSLQDLISRFSEKPAAEAPKPNVMKIRVLRDTSTPAAPQPEPVAELPIADPPVVEPPVFERVVTPPPPPEPLAAIEEPAAALPAEPPVAGSGEFSLPSGMHDRATLEFLRSDESLFSGLVVAIGLNDFDQLRTNVGAEAADDLVRSVGQLVKSLTSNLAGPQFFGAKASDDEFILAYNGEIGPAAQRRMAAVSERLWDFQLRSIGVYSVVFSWGASEANDETFSEAVDAALERMRETRQNRKAMGGDKGRKRVVA